jgi:hypothetical protein
MMVVLVKDQSDFYQVCNCTILDGLPSLNFYEGWYSSSVLCPEVLRAIRPLFVTFFFASQNQIG